MKLLAPGAMVVFALLSVARGVGQVQTEERWLRLLTPPSASRTAEQCVVVDADLYAHAAPGLRDVRLVQDDRELPYAMDESHDDRGEAASRGRAIFDPVAQGVLAHPPAGSPGQDLSPSRPVAEILLPAHVPVERITLRSAEPFPAAMHVSVSARPHPPSGPGMAEPEPERVAWDMRGDSPSRMVTLGANLQDEAGVAVSVEPAPSGKTDVLLEMRRREICYQPRTASPVLLLLGNAAALPARYDFAARYKPTAEPLLASMGPLSVNPSYRVPAPAAGFGVPEEYRLAAVLLLALLSFAVTAFAVGRITRR